MVAVAWAAIGLLAATLGVLATALFRLSSKIDAQGADLGAQIDALGASLGARIDAQGASLGTGIEALAQRFDTHFDRHAS